MKTHGTALEARSVSAILIARSIDRVECILSDLRCQVLLLVSNKIVIIGKRLKAHLLAECRPVDGTISWITEQSMGATSVNELAEWAIHFGQN